MLKQYLSYVVNSWINHLRLAHVFLATSFLFHQENLYREQKKIKHKSPAKIECVLKDTHLTVFDR